MAKSQRTIVLVIYWLLQMVMLQDFSRLLKLLLLDQVPPDLLLDVQERLPRLVLLLHRHDVNLRTGKHTNMSGTCIINRDYSVQAGNDASCQAGSCPLSL